MPIPTHRGRVATADNIDTVARVPRRTAASADHRILTRRSKAHPGCSIECRCHEWKRTGVRLTVRWGGVVTVSERFTTPQEAWEYAATYARQMVRQRREYALTVERLEESARSSSFGDGVVKLGGLRCPSGFTYTVQTV